MSSLLYVMYGEPRGLGNHNDCAGTNQLDVFLGDRVIIETVDKIHVLWAITSEKVSFVIHWDNTYMIDKNGDRFEATEYLPKEDIVKNIDRYMQPYLDRVSYEIVFRPNKTCRWNSDFHEIILRAIDEDYDFIYWHRPDQNLQYEPYNDPHRLFRQFMSSTTGDPAVFIAAGPSNSIWELRQSDNPDYNENHTGIFVYWNNYESMMWNKYALRKIEPFFKMKAQNEHFYYNDLHKTEFDGYDPWLSWSEQQRLDTGENLWSIVFMMVSICNFKFSLVDKLPFRCIIRSLPNNEKTSERRLK